MHFAEFKRNFNRLVSRNTRQSLLHAPAAINWENPFISTSSKNASWLLFLMWGFQVSALPNIRNDE